MLKSNRHVYYILERSPGVCKMLPTEHDWLLLFNQNHIDPVVCRGALADIRRNTNQRQRWNDDSGFFPQFPMSRSVWPLSIPPTATDELPGSLKWVESVRVGIRIALE